MKNKDAIEEAILLLRRFHHVQTQWGKPLPDESVKRNEKIDKVVDGLKALQTQEKPCVDVEGLKRNAIISIGFDSIRGGRFGKPDTHDVTIGGIRMFDYLHEQGHLNTLKTADNPTLTDTNVGQIPEGYALVPVKPTDEMLIAGRCANAGPRGTVHTYIYEAMIKAAKGLENE